MSSNYGQTLATCPQWSALLAISAMLALTGCAQTSWRSGIGPSQTLATANQMMDIEETDRINRFQRLARLDGVAAPKIDRSIVPAALVPGATRPIPVIRIVFDERVFFDTDNTSPRSETAKVLELIAENMRHDVPDLRITVLGHTDAVGSESGNYALSQRRALAVLQILIRDGVDPAQLGTVAIGKAQPVATNATAEGRARNRRVEFLISPSEEANLQVVETRRTNPAYLQLAPGTPSAAKTATAGVQFLKPTYTGPADFSEAPLAGRQITLTEIRRLPLQTAALDVGETGSPVARASLQPTATDTGSPGASSE